MYQDSQRENVHIIKSIRAWKACRSFAGIVEWNTISAAFGTKMHQASLHAWVFHNLYWQIKPRQDDSVGNNEITF